ncbi:MAG: hypothetical protein IKU14_03300, partial [Rhodocyclaceae bacterium]|nr:hypothetical protein [Rhodocyclaceae bacterium]
NASASAVFPLAVGPSKTRAAGGEASSFMRAKPENRPEANFTRSRAVTLHGRSARAKVPKKQKTVKNFRPVLVLRGKNRFPSQTIVNIFSQECF